MSTIGKRKSSILSPHLLQMITQCVSQNTPSESSENLNVRTPISAEIPKLMLNTVLEEKKQSPSLILRKEFEKPTQTPKRSSNFLKGCKWSPDGLCLLTNSDDNQLRLFEIPCDRLPTDEDLTAVLHLQEPESIYDFDWFPYMNSSQSETCFLFSTCRLNPVHLFDAYTGQVRACYKALNHLEELVAAYSLGYDIHSGRLFCGYDRTIRAFDLEKPGQCVEKWDIADRKKDVYQSGIISCFSFNPQVSGMYAAGSYARTVGIYGDVHGELIALLHGHTGGLTHLRFSPDGNQLYSGARKDGTIFCWDIRNLGGVLGTYSRRVDTNQRIYFDFDPSFTQLMTGNTNGHVSGWNLKENNNSNNSVPDIEFLAHEDCTNGISFHPTQPLLATCSGQRRFAGDIQTSTSEDEDENNLSAELNLKKIPRENSVKIWPLVKSNN